MFKKQFKITAKQDKGMREICCFSASIYIKHWFAAPNAASSPFNDLCLLKNLKSYKGLNEELASRVLQKLKNHLWY